MNHKLIPRRGFLGALFASAALLITQAPADAAKGPRPSSISLVPTIDVIEVVNNQLVASGTATAVIRGKTVTAPFQNVPLNLSLANPADLAVTCPVIDLELGPINLNLLGLIVETSPICLTIDADPSGGLLGQLLCSVANLLNQGGSLADVLAGLTASDRNLLVDDLLNPSLQQLSDAELVGTAPGANRRQCAILNLELGPVTLNLLGAVVNLDDCNGGPVTVDITAQRGALLGDLLCPLLGGGLIPTGLTLGNILDILLSQLTP